MKRRIDRDFEIYKAGYIAALEEVNRLLLHDERISAPIYTYIIQNVLPQALEERGDRK